MAVERGHLLACATEGLDLAEIVFPLVDKQGCVTVKTNFYSVPVRAGTRVEARVHPLHVEIWHVGRLIARHERCHNGTRAMVAVLALGREFGQDRLGTAIAATIALGACDVAAVRYLLTEAGLHKAKPAPIDVGALARYDRPLPDLADYDTLLSGPCAGTA